MKKKCDKCGSPYYREYDIIGAKCRVCRICDHEWDNTKEMDKKWDKKFAEQGVKEQ